MSAMPRRAMAPVKYSMTRLGASSQGGVSFPGGLDQTTPSLTMQPGALRDGLNFECALTGGYSRIAGYERFDGRPSPSDASYLVVQVTSFTNVPAVGDAITQSGSGATGTVAAVNNETGAYYMVLTKTAGSFASSGTITKTGPVTIGSTTTTTVSLTAEQNSVYLNAAADIYRADIGAVPGSGPILGVVSTTFGGDDFVYAFRNNAGGTAVDLYKSSTGGWVQVPFFNTVEFTLGGAATALDGDTLTQGGVTATIKRVMTRSGTWTGTAAGAFVVTNPSGGNFAAGAATTSSGATVTLSGVQTAITLLPDGRFQFDIGNFGGSDLTERIYGCDGVNKAFEFDGETLAPISTGLSDDRPSNIVVHLSHLFVSFQSSILHSGPGLPFMWLAVNGGGEIATGAPVTNLLTLPGAQTTGTLGVYQRNGTRLLYGTSSADWNLVRLNTGGGGAPYSAQAIFDAFSFDELGVVTLQTTLNFGNFAASPLTRSIMPFILRERSLVSASCTCHSKSQYRVFFSDGYGLFLTFANQQYLGAMPVYFPNPVNVAWQDTDSAGDEVIYFGSNDNGGYIYQMEKGSSFDGGIIDAYLTLPWDFMKSPRILKRYRAASIEIQSDYWVELQFGYQLGYASSNIHQPTAGPLSSNFVAAPVWDEFTWDEFVWDGVTLSPSDVSMVGTAENVQVTITSGTDYIQPFTLNSVIYHYSMRRGLRV